MAAKDTANAILKDLKAQNDERSQGVYSREKLKAQKGQILVVNSTKFKKIIQGIFPDIEDENKGGKTGTLNLIWDDWKRFLSTAGKTLTKERIAELDRAMLSLKPNLPRTSHLFAIVSYPQIRKASGANKELGEIIKKRYTKSKTLKKDGKLAIELIGGQGSKMGKQLGHEEAGRGIATSVMGAASTEQRFGRMKGGGQAKTKILKHIQKYYEDMEVRIDSSQIIDAKGGIKKDYIPILFWQPSSGEAYKGAAKDANQGERQRQETDFMLALQGKIQDEIDGMKEGSTPLIEAVEMVLFNAAAPRKKRRSTKITGKRKEKINEKSTGRAKTRLRRTAPPVDVIHDDGVDSKSLLAMKRKGSNAERAVSPFSYLAMINKKLPETVRRNMTAPRLENQTGRFASSVKLQDVNTTPQGYPSFGYTYQKDPYQVFEVGTGAAPWSTSQRDPRKLIDRSIRQVAAELAIGRFYTRRL